MNKNKKKYHHGDLKNELIRAGLDILRDEGMNALTLRAIAAKVGVSHTAPKNHFDGFQGLLSAIAAEGYRLHAAEMLCGVKEADGPEDRLKAAFEGYVRFARENPALFRLMFSPRFVGYNDPNRAKAGQVSYNVLKSVAEGLKWPKPGPKGSADIETFRTELMLWSFAHGYASLLIEGVGPRKPDGSPLLDILEIVPDFSRCMLTD